MPRLELRLDFRFTDISNLLPPPATPTAEDVPGEAPGRITDEIKRSRFADYWLATLDPLFS